MDWALAVRINHSALSRIVAALAAMVGLSADGALARLPRPVYRAALAVLRPAESAVRRLIVIAARGVTAEPRAARPMPAGLALQARGGARASFQLFDARKRFATIEPRRAAPRILGFGASPLVPLFQPRADAAAEADAQRDDDAIESTADDTVDATRLGRRLHAVKLALEDLPRQAKRLRRLQARRKRMTRPAFVLPLRPGLPPGHRKAQREEIDRVLTECHALARDALHDDSS
jgi:hypothetical protein